MRFFIILYVFFSTNFSFAQYKNSFKINAVGPLSKLYSAQYERKLSKHFSINNTFFYRQKTLIPLGVQVDTLVKRHGVGLTGIKFQYIFMNEARVGVKGYSPELRYYIGKKKNRTFLSLFGQYENFDMSIPSSLAILFKGLVLDAKVPVNFTLNTLSGGLLIGKQFQFNRLGLDLVIIGPHFGTAKAFYGVVETDLLSQLSETEKLYLQNKIVERFGLSEKYFTLNINEERAEIKSIKPIPYVGIRGFGVNLSYNF
jgi:hypothetical protein